MRPRGRLSELKSHISIESKRGQQPEGTVIINIQPFQILDKSQVKTKIVWFLSDIT